MLRVEQQSAWWMDWNESPFSFIIREHVFNSIRLPFNEPAFHNFRRAHMSAHSFTGRRPEAPWEREKWAHSYVREEGTQKSCVFEKWLLAKLRLAVLCECLRIEKSNFPLSQSFSISFTLHRIESAREKKSSEPLRAKIFEQQKQAREKWVRIMENQIFALQNISLYASYRAQKKHAGYCVGFVGRGRYFPALG